MWSGGGGVWGGGGGGGGLTCAIFKTAEVTAAAEQLHVTVVETSTC